MNTLSALFSEQARLTPERIALVFESEQFTYQQLEERSNQLAHYLIQKGAKTESLIPICLNRSIEMIVGILGILKAGAAYVPIDPAYPKERISYVLADTNCSIVLTDTDNALLMQSLIGNKLLITIAATEECIDKMETTLPAITILPSNLAYVIYTSGSTGTPKGVMIEHGSVASFITNQTAYFSIHQGERILQFSNYCFDASVEQIFLALFNGATLVIAHQEILIDNSKFELFINEQKITHLHATPGFLNNIDPLKIITIKRIVAGGDVCKKDLLKKWIGIGDFYNKYGPTETTVTVIAYKRISKDLDNLKTTPIGKPLKNVLSYILDKNHREVNENEAGELYIGGIQVARGYHNQPELTKKYFIESPFDKGERLYRTGDLVRKLEDGNLEFIERIDQQVKIRGYRIEIGEIENVLLENEKVLQCAIVVNESLSEKSLVAFIVAKSGFDKKEIIKDLLLKLPTYMIPAIWVQIDKIPLTHNGKVDKKALIIPDPSAALNNVYIAPKANIEKQIAIQWRKILNVKRVGLIDNFFELGGNSLLAQRTISALKNELNINLAVTKLYQYPTIAGLAKLINKTTIAHQSKTQNNFKSTLSADIAVIGMAGRFPGSDTIEDFWKLIIENRETTTFFKDAEIDASVPAQLKNDPCYVKARGIINNTSQFDPAFFGINTKLAELMDPQQRVFLEIAWEALEQTGHLPNKYEHKIGVFAGFGTNTYYENNVLSHLEKIENQGKMQVLSVNEKDYAASRTAYHLNLKGPAVSVNSACSTSLLAITQAVNSLRANQCDVALAGGASITSPVNSGHLYQEGSMLSADGHCKPFDDSATGTVFSDGAGVVLLKRLAEAQQDGDVIFAVIKGVGINNDGYGKGSFTAPSSEGQSDAIASAIADAGIEASQISYIEAHGTGTPIGDPIEFEGLVDAFGPQEKNQYCAIGSVKSNFGHLRQAAGVAGFIKTSLALYHKKLPASLGYKVANRNIDFENSPFFVNSSLADWETEGKRITGVSSFGVGGTNVHVILEEYENERPTSDQDHGPTLITWSANSAISRESYGLAIAKYIKSNPDVKLADIAYSLNKSRADFRYRRYAIASSKEEMLNMLEKSISTNVHLLTEIPGEIVFTFPGQGAQYLNMGSQLYANEEVYKNAIDECAEILWNYIYQDIRKILFPDELSDEATELLKNTKFTQPAMFVTEYALAKLWMSYGVEPTLFCGHSIGEYVAAHLSGIFSLEDGLKLIANRAALISELPSGAMLSVRESEVEVATYLNGDLSIAAVNSPKLVVVAGPNEQIETLSKVLDKKEIVTKLLFTSHAFHSSMMDPILEQFKAVVLTVELASPKIPIVSTVTGVLLTDQEALDPMYWTLHLRKPVIFAKAIEHILTFNSPVFLEVGPGNVTSTLTKQIAASLAIPSKALSSIIANQDEQASFLKAIGQLWIYGAEPNLNKPFEGENRQFLSLPSYQFDRKRYWVEILDKNIAIPNHETTTINLRPQTTKLNTHLMRKNKLTAKVKQVLEDASGIEMNGMAQDQNFLEIGLDSLLLTQVAISLKREFNLPITFRKLNEEYASIESLVEYLDQTLAPEPATMPAPEAAFSQNTQQAFVPDYQNNSYPQNNVNTLPQNNTALGLIAQQLEILSKQVMLMQGGVSTATSTTVTPIPNQKLSGIPIAENGNALSDLSQEEKAEIQKPFGAAARIEKQSSSLNKIQAKYLASLIQRYNEKTKGSKAYTQKHRSYMADPRVVSGFKPATKELIYPIVINKSKGSHVWDIDGNEYIDALNGFGSNMLGYQPDFIKNALIEQIEKGYEIGPQHELAGEVAQLICEFTKFDRAGLCNTGSEAVLGAMRISRTVTGRSLIVAFTGSYHGITDEVIVRGSKKFKTFPAAAGIMPAAVQHMLILDYGTDETLDIIARRAHEIAAVLVEPIQSRRPDFQPIEFLKKLRKITEDSETVLIFDEVISGFRFHPAGIQGLFDIQADLGTYGKVAGGGISIGIIAGKKKYMDALDGGFWQFGDDSIPEIGVTYFAGTFVRHPLALATAKASLNYLKQIGPQLQENLNAKGLFIANAINAICRKLSVPMYIAQFGSLWRIKFIEDYPYTELFFTLMRLKGIHVLEGFACFLTTAHTNVDIAKIITCFEESLIELKESGLIPTYKHAEVNTSTNSLNLPPLPNARLGKDKEGNPAWFIEDEKMPGKYLQVT